MNIFYGKPFAIACVSFVIGSLIGFFGSIGVKALSLSVLAIVLIISVILFICKKKTSTLTNAILPGILAVFGILYFTAFTQNIDADMERYSNANAPSHIEATVLSRRLYSNYLCIYEIRVHSINGDKVNKKFRFESERALDLSEGERISSEVYISDFDNSEGFDQKRYFNSKGYYFLALEANESCKVTGKDSSIELLFYRLKRSLCIRTSSSLSKNASGIVNAVFLGDRDALEDKTVRDFKRTGTYHVLALSGMHLSVLSFMLDVFLKKLRMGKSIRFVLEAILIVFYCILTGLGLSVVRSAVMVIMSMLAYFFRSRSDPFTNLTFAASSIILFSPSAVCDIGLWMSVLATFGILTAIPLVTLIKFKLRRFRKNRATKIAVSVLPDIIYSLSAVLFTVPFSCFSFKAISIAGPFATLVLSPLISGLLIFSPLFLIFAEVPVISNITVFVIELLSSIIIAISSKLSSFDNIFLSLNYPFVKYLIIPFFIILCLMLIFNMRHRFFILLYISAFAVLFGICEYTHINDGALYTDYLQIKKNEYFILSENGKNTLIDISDGSSGSLYKAGLKAIQRGECEIEAVVLTHLHKKHVNSLNRLSDRILVRRLYIPRAVNNSEELVFASVLYGNISDEVEIIAYSAGEDLEIYENVILETDRGYLKRSTHPAVQLVLTGRIDVSYIGSSYYDYAEALTDSENIILGIHGPVCKNKMAVNVFPKTEAVYVTGETVLGFLELYGKQNIKMFNNCKSISFYRK